MNNNQDIYDINSEEAVRAREHKRAVRDSGICIVLSLISIAYLMASVAGPLIGVDIIPEGGKLFRTIVLCIAVLLSLLLAIVGFHDEENPFRIPALILSIIPVFVIIADIILILLKLFGFLAGLYEKYSWLFEGIIGK